MPCDRQPTRPAFAISRVCTEGPHAAAKHHEKLTGVGKAWDVEGQPIEVGLRKIVSHCMRDGPFDGAFGFSQGACVLALLCDKGVWTHCGGSAEAFPPWRFLICGCGTDYLLDQPREAPRLPSHGASGGALFEMPSLHIMGKTDQILSQSQELSRRFCVVGPEVVLHDEGHAIPLSLMDEAHPVRTAVKAFVRKHAFEQDYAHAARPAQPNKPELRH